MLNHSRREDLDALFTVYKDQMIQRGVSASLALEAAWIMAYVPLGARDRNQQLALEAATRALMQPKVPVVINSSTIPERLSQLIAKLIAQYGLPLVLQGASDYLKGESPGPDRDHPSNWARWHVELAINHYQHRTPPAGALAQIIDIEIAREAV